MGLFDRIRGYFSRPTTGRGLQTGDDEFFVGVSPNSFRDRTEGNLQVTFENSLQAWRENALARRIVNLYTQYVVGPGCKVECDNENAAAFLEKFWMPEKGYLKDVLSGTNADEQLRCNQIWAVSMSFIMPDETQALAIVNTVEKYLRTDRGLRTLSPEDPEYHGFYGGKQFDRDMAYHQGTAWVFPLGAWCRAFLRAMGHTPAAADALLEKLSAMEDMLTEGCIGQLPEIYDGNDPYEGKGCYAQAWSVGEMLRVFEAVEKIDK